MVTSKMKAILLAAAVAFSGASFSANSQVISDHAKNAVKESVSKDAKDEAKKFKKEGWKVKPGALPLQRQLDRSYKMMLDIDDEGQSKYVWGNKSSEGQVYDAARAQAIELAKQEVATQIASELQTEIESNVGNDQAKLTSVAKTVEKSKGLVTANLGRLNIVVEAYKENKKGVEVLVRVAYDYKQVKEALIDKVREELQKESEDLLQDFDKAVK